MCACPRARSLATTIWLSPLSRVPNAEHATEFVATELGQHANGDHDARRLTATLRVYVEENMSPLWASQILGVQENTITNRARAAQELLPIRSSIALRSCWSRSA
jgi:DNA-binding PucR family transcriptional regulator